MDAATIPHEVAGLMINNNWPLVKAWRKHLKLTQKEIAAKAGISPAALSQMEKPDSTPHTATLKKLATAMLERGRKGVRSHFDLSWRFSFQGSKVQILPSQH